MPDCRDTLFLRITVFTGHRWPRMAWAGNTRWWTVTNCRVGAISFFYPQSLIVDHKIKKSSARLGQRTFVKRLAVVIFSWPLRVLLPL